MNTSVNLLPWSWQRRRLIRRRLLQWAVVAVAAAVAGTLGTWREHARLSEARRELAARQDRYELQAQLARENNAMRAALARLGNRQTLAGRLAAAPPPLTALALVSRAAMNCQGSVRVDSFGFDDVHNVNDDSASKSPKKRASQPPTQVDGPSADEQMAKARLSLAGVGLDHLAVSRFVLHLRDTGAFEVVELKSAGEGVAGHEGLSTYQIECEFANLDPPAFNAEEDRTAEPTSP